MICTSVWASGAKNAAAVALGRLGGLAGKGSKKPSAAIKAAARANGKLGGRPRKAVAHV